MANIGKWARELLFRAIQGSGKPIDPVFQNVLKARGLRELECSLSSNFTSHLQVDVVICLRNAQLKGKSPRCVFLHSNCYFDLFQVLNIIIILYCRKRLNKPNFVSFAKRYSAGNQICGDTWNSIVIPLQSSFHYFLTHFLWLTHIL